MIPSWTMEGIIPPVRPGVPGFSPDRSPYVASMSAVVDRFAFNEKRVEILRGFFRFRRDLHAAGVRAGFQWIDGSFMENVEGREARTPNDIDVVTFFELPAGETQASFSEKHIHLLDSKQTKTSYLVDGYPQIIGAAMSRAKVRSVAYWESMWAHRRTGQWKGFVEVDLSTSEDFEAHASLNALARKGVGV